MGYLLLLLKELKLFEFCNYGFSGFVSVHSRKVSRVLGHLCGLVYHLHEGKVVGFSYFKVKGVVSGSYLHRPRSEIHLHPFVRNNGDEVINLVTPEVFPLPVDEGKASLLSYEVFIPLVVGIDRYRGVSEHGLGSRGSYRYELSRVIPVLVNDGILYIPECSGLFFVFNL